MPIGIVQRWRCKHLVLVYGVVRIEIDRPADDIEERIVGSRRIVLADLLHCGKDGMDLSRCVSYAQAREIRIVALVERQQHPGYQARSGSIAYPAGAVHPGTLDGAGRSALVAEDAGADIEIPFQGNEALQVLEGCGFNGQISTRGDERGS
ncbi:hypothetical protein D9M69_342870 [compost metagenome]